ncbi:unnamed protein product [Nippostrongylus brasiliensis]|uniref:Hypotheticial protein n=1 Tax=Nippostrongylus brasiliensis TaxID=27835 RepID=A0A0N4Y0W3_NIPBR|nr:hypothetical protein Q1695_002759 [Nippostrongylus brasiliensis]VDL72802.1 unnamed protein product [Nippostrongylus brasiliensis]
MRVFVLFLIAAILAVQAIDRSTCSLHPRHLTPADRARCQIRAELMRKYGLGKNDHYFNDYINNFYNVNDYDDDYNNNDLQYNNYNNYYNNFYNDLDDDDDFNNDYDL